MRTTLPRTAVLWTGGKDCNLALYEAKVSGYPVFMLVTFIMSKSKFKAHPIRLMKLQSESLGIQHISIPISTPYKDNYEKAIRKLNKEYGIETLVTGDIAEVNGNTNWITERCKPMGVKVILPLWHRDREDILNQLFTLNYKVIFTFVKQPWFDASWLGTVLNDGTQKKFRNIKNLDHCGEQGEYHTMTLDGPGYRKAISIDAYSTCTENGVSYMNYHKTSFKKKLLEHL